VRGLYKLVHTREAPPGRCARAREADELQLDLRQIVFKSHRIVFRIEVAAGTVRVLRVFHSARQGLSKEELGDH
jgi:plasmid stabilization system protein ParE